MEVGSVVQQRPCLVAENSSYRNIGFEGDEVTVGRSMDTSVCLPSAVISRNHATITKSGQQWHIVDNSSLNGVFINDVKLRPCERTLMCDGDKVSFGMKRGDEDYVYTFRNKAERTLKRKDAEPKCCHAAASKKVKITPELHEALEKSKMLEKKLSSLQQWASERGDAEKALREQIDNEKHMNCLMNDRLTDILRMNTFSFKEADKVKWEEHSYMRHLRWMSEKHSIERTLSNEEVSSPKQCMLVEQKNTLEKLISTKEVELQLLQKASIATNLAMDMKRAKKELLMKFNDVLEAELQCPICSELFIEATTLNCSHTFCLKCIRDWMAKKQKNPECPICRAGISIQVKSVVLDSFINRSVELFTPDQMTRRKQLVRERNAPPYKDPRCWNPRRRRTSYAEDAIAFQPIVWQHAQEGD